MLLPTREEGYAEREALERDGLWTWLRVEIVPASSTAEKNVERLRKPEDGT
jgi:hypothetical protein